MSGLFYAGLANGILGGVNAGIGIQNALEERDIRKAQHDDMVGLRRDQMALEREKMAQQADQDAARNAILAGTLGLQSAEAKNKQTHEAKQDAVSERQVATQETRANSEKAKTEAEISMDKEQFALDKRIKEQKLREDQHEENKRLLGPILNGDVQPDSPESVERGRGVFKDATGYNVEDFLDGSVEKVLGTYDQAIKGTLPLNDPAVTGALDSTFGHLIQRGAGDRVPIPQVADTPPVKGNTKGWNDYGYGPRQDGTPKGNGYYGPLKLPNGGIASEYSIGVDINGKQVDIPTFVPGLTKEELASLKDAALREVNPPESVVRKAMAYAKSRIDKGLSPFASIDEEGKTALPEQPTGVVDHKELVGLQPMKDKPGWYVPMVKTYVKGDDGKMYDYTAPLTRHGTHDPNDPVMPVNSLLMDRHAAGLLMLQHKFRTDPEFAKRMEAYTQSPKDEKAKNELEASKWKAKEAEEKAKAAGKDKSPTPLTPESSSEHKARSGKYWTDLYNNGAGSITKETYIAEMKKIGLTPKFDDDGDSKEPDKDGDDIDARRARGNKKLDDLGF